MGRHILTLTQQGLLLFGIGALGYSAAVIFDVNLFQRRANRIFEDRLSNAQPTRPRDPALRASVRQPAPSDGSIIARLEIPRLGEDLVVVEGDTARDLQRAPGHIPGTPLPGQPGNIGIAAHRDSFFRPLRLIRTSDVINVITPHGTDHYRVVSTEIVKPTDVRVLSPTGQDCLTLVTCYPFYYVGAAPYRFIVRANRLMEESAASRE